MTDLVARARGARERAYAPYSGFRVGCALRAEDGRVFTGCNVENAAYPQGQCAEASAIGVMIAAGAGRIVEAAVAGDGDRPCAPCGGCRQRLNEFAAPDLPVHMAGAEGRFVTVSLGTLLPHAFGPADLARDGPAPAAGGNGTEGGRASASATARGAASASASARPGGSPVVPAPGPSDAADLIRARAPGIEAEVAFVLGSGLGALADAVEAEAVLPYAELPGFPRPTVEGHAGELVLGRLEGVRVAVMRGRAHLYEGAPASWPAAPLAALKGLGCRVLVLTNAAGSLRPEVGPGRVALIEDHVNLLAANPLTGPNDDAAGPRFPDMSRVYDPALRAALRAAATSIGLDLAGGVYLAVPGPSFETPAEIRAFRALGADLVGMSTVPEAIAAVHRGFRVAGLSVVTNLAAGLEAGPLSHDRTLAAAASAARDALRLIRAWLRAAAPVPETPP